MGPPQAYMPPPQQLYNYGPQQNFYPDTKFQNQPPPNYTVAANQMQMKPGESTIVSYVH
jgi:hypothetical protein